MQDIKAEIQKLVKTIHELMGRSKGGWVTWTQVARQQTGSAEAAFLLSGQATLPEWKHLFHDRVGRTDHRVFLKPAIRLRDRLEHAVQQPQKNTL